MLTIVEIWYINLFMKQMQCNALNFYTNTVVKQVWLYTYFIHCTMRVL